MNLVKHDFTDLYLNDIGFTWKRLITPLSRADKNTNHIIESKKNKPVLVIVFDGIVQADFGLSLETLGTALQSHESIQTDNQLHNYTVLNKNDKLLLTGDQCVTLFARSAWTANILSVQLHLLNEVPSGYSVLRNGNQICVGNIGLWRSLSQPVQEILALDSLYLLIGSSNTLLGANYSVFNESIRVIEFKLAPGRELPKFHNNKIVYLLGLSGSVKIQNNSGFSDWLNPGSIAILRASTEIFWDIKNITQESEEAIFLVLIVAANNEEGFMASIKLENSIWDRLLTAQGTIWSRVSWPLLRNSGVEFG